MKFRLYLILILLVLFGCKRKIPDDFNIIDYYSNNKIKTISKDFGDTIINNNNYKNSYVIYYREDGSIEREGKYLDLKAYGNHYFYDEDNDLNCIRNYHVWTEDEKYLIINSNLEDSIFIKELRNELTFLNEVYYLNKNKDTIAGGSYIKIEIDKNKIKIGEVLSSKIIFKEDLFKITHVKLIFNIPDDTSSIIILQAENTKIDFKQKSRKMGINSISGIAFIDGFQINNSKDTISKGRIAIFDKKYLNL